MFALLGRHIIAMANNISLYNIASPVTSLGPAAKDARECWGAPSSREVVICKSVWWGPARLAV